MAISMKKYVEISSRYSTPVVSSRSLSGCVFTPEEMSVLDDEKKVEYDKGRVIAVTKDEVGVLFGSDSAIVKFADKYYSYISRSGNSSGLLRVCKVLKSGADGYETPASAFERAIGDSVTFGSFTFLEASGLDYEYNLTQEDLLTVAGKSAAEDGRFLFVVNDVRGTQTAAEVVAKSAPYSAISGCVFVSGNDRYSAYMPMAIFDSVDYTNGPVPCHMYKQFASEVSTVSSDADYEDFKDANVNFYGRTKVNGSNIDFYQRGFNADGQDTSIYCNEIWFKSACSDVIMSRLLKEERLPANEVGVAIVKNDVGSVCSIATVNGAFMAKDIEPTDYEKIIDLVTRLGGEGKDVDNIVREVSLVGYSIFCKLRKDKSGENFIDYYVFYGTADSVRFVRGTNYLIG